MSKELNIPNDIKKIGSFCCCGYEELSKLSLHNGLKEIGDFAFYSSELESLSLPDTVNKLGESCFELSEIETLKLSSNIISIPDMCFAYAEISELDSLYYKTNDNLVLEHKYNGIAPRKKIAEIPHCMKVN